MRNGWEAKGAGGARLPTRLCCVRLSSIREDWAHAQKAVAWDPKYMHVCVYTCIDLCIMYLYIYIHTYTYLFIYILIYPSTYLFIYLFVLRFILYTHGC